MRFTLASPIPVPPNSSLVCPRPSQIPECRSAFAMVVARSTLRTPEPKIFLRLFDSSLHPEKAVAEDDRIGRQNPLICGAEMVGTFQRVGCHRGQPGKRQVRAIPSS